MAHHLSAKKRIRQSNKRRIHNRYFAVSTRNMIKEFKETEDKDTALELYPKICSKVDKLAKKNIIHKNKAAHIKSKLYKQMQTL